MGYDKAKAERDLRKAGGCLKRHGSRHDVWEVNGKLVIIPRHKGRDLSPKVKQDIDEALGRKS